MVGRTARFYHTHPRARAVKAAYMKNYNKHPDRVKYRKELRRARRRRGIDGKRHAILRRFAPFH